MTLRQIILDTETTGLEPTKGHRLTEIGCLEMKNRRLTGRSFHTYLNPEREIDSGAIRITGLTSEFLLDKPKFHEIMPNFLSFLQEEPSELIIHNAPFDLGFLNHELSLAKSELSTLTELPVIDTLVMARQLHPGQRNNLDALCKRYNVDNSNRNYHGALLDAEILAKVYLAMTAGQTIMSLEDTSTKVLEQNFEFEKIKRNPAIPLQVLYTSKEANQIHLKRMSELEASD